MTAQLQNPQQHDYEPHIGSTNERLNWLRAGVLGANDGIVSTASLLVGVAASGASNGVILTAGLAGLSSGALSMAVGEYVSVSTQRDTESALIAKERRELAEQPEEELAELAGIYEAKGLEPRLAREVAVALTEKDALAAHAEAELGIDHEEFTNPWHAAWASMFSFIAGALLPLIMVLLVTGTMQVPATVAAAAGALALTGWTSARLGYADPRRAILRVVGGGLLAMALTFLIGSAVGTQVG